MSPRIVSYTRSHCNIFPLMLTALLLLLTLPLCAQPAAPGNLTATVAGNQAMLSWNASAGAVGYDVWGQRNNGPSVHIAFVLAPNVTYAYPLGKLYGRIIYAVYAYDKNKVYSKSSNTATIYILTYTDQQSATSKRHSGICTSPYVDANKKKQPAGVVWDDYFDRLVEDAIFKVNGGSNFNEVAFAFMQCFGGGLIDELLALPISPVAYTSAARHNEFSWAFGKNPMENIPESTYNRALAPTLAMANTSFKQIATAGLDGDVLGPVSRLAALTTPQYVSNGFLADAIRLHQNNPLLPTANTAYLAVVFGGSTDDPINAATVSTIYKALLGRGYARNEIYLCYTNGNKATNPPLDLTKTPPVKLVMDDDTSGPGMNRAWEWVKANTSPTTQVFFWSSWGHGTNEKDGSNARKVAPPFQKTFAINYDLDVTGDFLSQVQTVYNYNLSQGLSGTDLPYLEVSASQQITGLIASLNGRPLSPLAEIDLYGDGSVFEYAFALTPSDLLALQGAGNTVTLAWDSLDIPFDHVDINLGQVPNGINDAPFVTGQVQLDSVVNPEVPIQFEFRSANNAPAFTQTTTLNPDGTFALVGVSADTYTLHIKGDRWLAQNVPVDTTSGPVDGVLAMLEGGDANNDNVVNPTDFGILTNAYSTYYDPNDPGNGYDLRADFNNDGTIDVLDFGILVSRYGEVGDL